MIILLLAEARSGSTNLAIWLKKSFSNFELLNEPYNPKSQNYIGDGEIDITKNYIISEKYYNNESLIKKIITISDSVICLYREDSKSQIESFITAKSTDNWNSQYVDVILNDSFIEIQNEFLENKINFKNFILNNKFKSFTYEQLYYGNQITDLKNYLNIQSNVTFPYGEKYRKTGIIKTLI